MHGQYLTPINLKLKLLLKASSSLLLIPLGDRCHYEAREQCTQVPVEECHEVPRHECHEVTEHVCDKDPQQRCEPVQSHKCLIVPDIVPNQVSGQ